MLRDYKKPLRWAIEDRTTPQLLVVATYAAAVLSKNLLHQPGPPEAFDQAGPDSKSAT
jgi:hypothetical protein